MEEVIIKCLSLLLILFLGYISKKKAILTIQDSNILSTVITKFTLPVTILCNCVSYEISFTVILLILFGIFSNLIGGIFSMFFTNKDEISIRSTTFLNSIGYNIGNLTLIFVSLYYPKLDLIYLFMFDLGNSFMCLGGSYALASSLFQSKETRPNFKFNLKMFTKSLYSSLPFMTYLFLFILSFFNISIPYKITQTLLPISQANIFLVMFMIGMRIEINFNKYILLVISKILIIRYLIISLMICITWNLPLSLVAKEIISICFLSSCSSVTPIFCKQLGDETAIASILNSITIILAFLGIFVSLMIFHKF